MTPKITLTQEEKEEYANNHVKFVYHMVHKFLDNTRKYDTHYEELVSASFYGLAKALDAFDKSNADSSSFTNYAGHVITNEILEILRKERRRKKITWQSFDVKIGKESDKKSLLDILPSPEDNHLVENELREVIKSVYSKLPNQRKIVFDMFMDGKNDTDIGLVIGLSRMRANAIRLEITRKMVSEFENSPSH